MTYKISDVPLEYDVVTDHELASLIQQEYVELELLYDRILRDRQILVDSQIPLGTGCLICPANPSKVFSYCSKTWLPTKLIPGT